MKKIAIIGAGPAGLTAAYELAKSTSDFSISVFEKENEVGGLSRSFKWNGSTVDIGGHRYFTTNPRVKQMWNDVLPPSANGMLLRKRKSHILFRNHLIDYPIQLNWNTISSLGLIGGLKAGFSYCNSLFNKTEITSLEDFYISRFGKTLYQYFFEQYTYKLWGLPASQLSADWGAQRIQKLSMKSILCNHAAEQRTSANQFLYPAFGSGQFWSVLSEKLMDLGCVIHTECRVLKIHSNGTLLSNIEYEKDHKIYQEDFDYLISSMPLNELIFSLENCPDELKEIAGELPYRDMMISAVEIDRSSMGGLLKQAPEDCWFYIQDEQIPFGRIQYMNNWSPYLVKDKHHIVLEMEYFCDKGDSLWLSTDTDLVAQSISALISCGFLKEESTVHSFMVRRIEKAYPVYTDGYAKMDQVRNGLNQIRNLFCIGRNGQHRYHNIDHAMETGFEAADCIIKNDFTKRRLWNVNTAQKYNEPT